MAKSRPVSLSRTRLMMFTAFLFITSDGMLMLPVTSTGGISFIQLNPHLWVCPQLNPHISLPQPNLHPWVYPSQTCIPRSTPAKPASAPPHCCSPSYALHAISVHALHTASCASSDSTARQSGSSFLNSTASNTHSATQTTLSLSHTHTSLSHTHT